MLMPVETICLVDDDEIYQYTTQKYIEVRKLAQKILSFPDGEIAIDYLQEHIEEPACLPDKILLDLSMPVMDGWEFLEEFVQLKPRIGKSIEVYIVSSSVNLRDLERARRISEVSDYIVKPINDDKLEQIFARVLDQS
ncbi:MAG: response regulator [Candidatus Melainabacteria bacterium HGW-Melainabacteria-1]|nr:MAG: response regulator [Candidatus Melainabacteria bacterium HGW-Melainabacteria-1]